MYTLSIKPLHAAGTATIEKSCRKEPINENKRSREVPHRTIFACGNRSIQCTRLHQFSTTATRHTERTPVNHRPIRREASCSYSSVCPFTAARRHEELAQWRGIGETEQSYSDWKKNLLPMRQLTFDNGLGKAKTVVV